MTDASRKNAVALLAVFALGSILMACAAFFDWGRGFLRLLWSGTFLGGLKVLLGIAVGLWILKRLTRRSLPQVWLKWIYGLFFLPVLLLPVFRCYFKVPYVFCRVCPHKCPWGMLRSIALPAFLFLNLSNKFWCASLCPLGTFQECQSRISSGYLKLPFWTGLLAYFILLIVTGLYLWTLFDPSAAGPFELGRYAWVEATIMAAVVILLIAFFVPKFWCRYFCPVGTIDDMVTTLTRRSSPGTKTF